MNVEFSQQANLSIEGYRNALVEQYGRSEDRANELKQQMEDTIRTRASNADSFPICQDVKLGQQKDGAGNALNKNLRYFKYESPKSHSAWGVSVLCDFENDLAIVYRIVHSSYLTEPPPGWKQQSNDSQQEKVKESNAKWLLLSKFVNRNTMRNNTMKKLNITKEQFNRSRYFQKKYGTLEYVSESGKVYKTSKGRVLKFNESVDVPTTLYVLMIDKDFNRDVKEISIDDKSEWNNINIDGGCFWEIDPESEEPEFFDGFGWGNDEDGYKKIIKVSDADTRDTISMEEFKELVDAMKCS